ESLLRDGNNFVNGFFGKTTIAKRLAENTSGFRNVLSDIDALMTLELIHRCLLRADNWKAADAHVDIFDSTGICRCPEGICHVSSEWVPFGDFDLPCATLVIFLTRPMNVSRWAVRAQLGRGMIDRHHAYSTRSFT